MDNFQLSKPLLSDEKSFEKDALPSITIDKEFKFSQIKPTTIQVSNDKAQLDPMKDALINISTVFNCLLPSEVSVPYRVLNIAKLSDEIHYLSSTCEGLALYIDTRTQKFDEKKISEKLNYVVILKGEQKAIFSGRTTLHEVRLPSLLPVKEKTFDFGVEIPKMIQSYDQNSLYVLLKEQKIVKVNPENFQEREDILEGNFTQMALARTGEFATFSNDGKLTLINLQTSSQEEVHISIDDISCLEYSNNQSKIIAASLRTVTIVSVSPLVMVRVFKMKENIYSPTIAFDENTLILGDDKGKLTFWDIKNKEQISEIQVHNKTITLVRLSYDGKLIYTNGLDGKICTLHFPEFTKELSTKVSDFEVLPSGNALLIKTNNDSSFKKWDLTTNTIEEVARIKKCYIEFYDIIDESTIMILGTDYIVKYNFMSKEGVEIPLVDDDSDYIYARSVSPDKAYYATGGNAQKVFLWDVKTMKKIKEFKGSDTCISKIIFLPSSNVIAAGNGNGIVFFWSISTGEFVISPIKAEKDQLIKSLNTFQNEENVVIGCENGSIFVYNWRAETLLATFKAGGKINRIHIVKDEKSLIVATNEGKITFWSIATYNQLFYYDIKQEIVYFQLTANEKYLAYTINKEAKDEIEKKEEGSEDENKSNKEKNEHEEDEEVKCGTDNLFIKKNPLATEVVSVAGPGSEFSYMKYVMNLLNNKGIQHNPESNQWIIMPYRINTLHLYSYLNHPNLLKLALEAGGSLFNTNFGENALSFAIKKQASGCISAVVSSFGKLLKGNPNALNFISEDCIIGLNNLGYPSLTKFYKQIYTPYKGKFIKFVDESFPTPIYYHSKEIYPLESNFFQNGQKKFDCKHLVGKPVACMSTSLPLPLTNGSKASIDFLDSLEECPNSAIFTTKLIQDILDHKWEDLRWAMYWQVIIYTIYMVLLSVYLLYFIGQSLPLVIIFIFSILLSSYELFQLITSPSEYIEDVWNYIDAIRTILTIVYVSLNWAEDEHSELSYNILLGIVIISWTRGITYFRIFKNTRYMVNLITQVIKDITSFLILLFYSTLAFAFIFLVMDKNDPKLIDYIKISYRLDLGDFDSSGFTSAQWICLFLATMTNMIIMLNLLISIMGDTFGRVQENAEIADRKELLGMIMEVETLMFWKKNFNESSYFQVLTGEESEEVEKNINTKVAAIKKSIKRSNLINQKRFETIEEMFIKIWTKLEGDKKEEKAEKDYEEESGEGSGEEEA